MALAAFNAFLWNGEPSTYVRKEKGKITGLLEIKMGEVETPEAKGGVSQYAVATYIVPKLTKSERTKLNKVCKKIKAMNSIKKVADEKLKKMGLTQEIIIPFAGTRERKNYENMSQVNKVLRFKDYESEELKL